MRIFPSKTIRLSQRQSQRYEYSLRSQFQQPPILLTAIRDIEHKLIKLLQRVEGSSYQTLEALATAVAQTTTMQFGLQKATISVKKPYAIAGIETASVQIHRTRSFFEESSIWASS